MKKCVRCKETKPKAKFAGMAKATDGLQYYCRECNTAYQYEYYLANKATYVAKATARKLRNRAFMLEYLKGKCCVDCGFSDIRALEFDHCTGNKKKEVSQLVQARYSISTIEKEIEKCEIRCANCHRIKTVEEFNWYRSNTA